MLDFLFTLKITLIFKLLIAKQLSYNERTKSNNTLLLSSRVILYLCKDLFKSYNYIIFINNFFSNVKLFKALKKKKINAYDTAKSSSEYLN